MLQFYLVRSLVNIHLFRYRNFHPLVHIDGSILGVSSETNQKHWSHTHTHTQTFVYEHQKK